MIKCFWMEPVLGGRKQVSLRRYASSSTGERCELTGMGVHNANVVIGEEKDTKQVSGDLHPHDDERWPQTCICGYTFVDGDAWQINYHTLYIRTDTKETMILRDAPVGTMWDADWYSKFWKGPDGRSLWVKTPGGDWCVDGKASNCTKPDDKEHKCWVRKGEPPNITVSKDGNTCAAGAGSIMVGDYHGFLRDGHLT